MRLTDEEKARVIDKFEDVEPSRRSTLLANVGNFASWLAGALYDIYVKVKSWIQDIWQWIRTHIF